jgi:hypothetical protein
MLGLTKVIESVWSNLPPIASLLTQPPPQQVNIGDLLTAYNTGDNEVATDQRYKGKNLEMQLSVLSVLDVNGNPYLVSYEMGADCYLQCQFGKDSVSQLATLHTDDIITIQGICAGKDISLFSTQKGHTAVPVYVVTLKECQIVQTPVARPGGDGSAQQVPK